jgi:hypothetical protein
MGGARFFETRLDAHARIAGRCALKEVTQKSARDGNVRCCRGHVQICIIHRKVRVLRTCASRRSSIARQVYAKHAAEKGASSFWKHRGTGRVNLSGHCSALPCLSVNCTAYAAPGSQMRSPSPLSECQHSPAGQWCATRCGLCAWFRSIRRQTPARSIRSTKFILTCSEN